MTVRPASAGLRSSQYREPLKSRISPGVTDAVVMRSLVMGDFQLPQEALFLAIFDKVTGVFC
jgi:hypothetical protein